ncbi:MAG: hypothetical protein ED557_13085 [Balneola sp.]|nr:MAG: hypothetical protein ED557_13085 [Balneola sp.]
MVGREHLFISDVHIGAFSPIKEEELARNLLTLIDYAIEHEALLYVLGDLFDYWMEFPKQNYIPNIGKEVLDKFEEYNRSVAKALFITGNHDNWTFGHFEDRGFDVERNYRVIELEGLKVLLMHGDGQFGKRDDFIRPFYHKVLRHPTFTKIFQKVFSPTLGLSFMKIFSNVTRKRNYRNPVPLNNHAESILNAKEIDLVLCGHDHIPRMETFSGGRYINSGPFFSDGTLVRYKNGAFELVKWHIETQEFVPFLSNSIEA